MDNVNAFETNLARTAVTLDSPSCVDADLTKPLVRSVLANFVVFLWAIRGYISGVRFGSLRLRPSELPKLTVETLERIFVKESKVDFCEDVTGQELYRLTGSIVLQERGRRWYDFSSVLNGAMGLHANTRTGWAKAVEAVTGKEVSWGLLCEEHAKIGTTGIKARITEFGEAMAALRSDPDAMALVGGLLGGIERALSRPEPVAALPEQGEGKAAKKKEAAKKKAATSN
jgi:hypothetical protein